MSTKEIASPSSNSSQNKTDNGANELMAIINRVATGPVFDVAKLQQLLAVKKEWEENEARKAFVVALSNFKAAPPEVLKSKSVDFLNTHYKHALLGDASAIIGAALSKHGLAHRWSYDQSKPGILRVTCTITHVLGHSESVFLEGPNDTSGSKNGIQAVGSASSYLERYTLFAATGIAAMDQDDDGRGSQLSAAPISGPVESPAGPQPAPTEPTLIKPGVVKKSKKSGEFIIPDLTENVNYHTLDEAHARALSLVGKNDGHVRVLFDYKDGKRFITSVDK